MSGKLRAILDTNAVVSLLAGNRKLALLLEQAEFIGISIITYLEFLAFDGLTDADRQCFATFCKRIQVLPLSMDDAGLLHQVLELRSRHRLKLTDAIIGATALVTKSLLITDDSHFSGVQSLTVQSC